MLASSCSLIDTVRQLLAAGADKRWVDAFGETARSWVGRWRYDNTDAAILALLDAAP